MRGVAGDRMAGSGEPVASEPVASELVASEPVASGRWSVAGGRGPARGKDYSAEFPTNLSLTFRPSMVTLTTLILSYSALQGNSKGSFNSTFSV